MKKSRRSPPTSQVERKPLLLTVAEAAQLLGLSRSTVYNLITARRLEVVYVGRSARVPYAAAVEFVTELRTRGGAA